MLVGGSIFFVGLVYFVLTKFGVEKLPGDFFWSNGKVSFAFPLMTSIMLSIIATVVINVFLRK